MRNTYQIIQKAIIEYEKFQRVTFDDEDSCDETETLFAHLEFACCRFSSTFFDWRWIENTF